LLDWTATVRARARGEQQTTHLPERAGLYTIVVAPEARGRGVAGALATSLFRAFQERGFDRCLYYDVNEANAASRRFVESYGAVGRVLYTAYEKALST
jgi:ribosomal protein S18 acetylase RimI-like enzyme